MWNSKTVQIFIMIWACASTKSYAIFQFSKCKYRKYWEQATSTASEQLAFYNLHHVNIHTTWISFSVNNLFRKSPKSLSMSCLCQVIFIKWRNSVKGNIVMSWKGKISSHFVSCPWGDSETTEILVAGPQVEVGDSECYSACCMLQFTQQCGKS